MKVLLRTNSIIQKMNNPIAYACISNIVYLGVLVLLFCPQYSSELDIIMQVMLYGIGGDGIASAHIIFSNIIIGKLLNMMIIIMPYIPWYAIVQYIAVYLSFVIISYVTLVENYSITGKIVSGLMIVFAGYECYITPSYLKTAVILCVAAGYWFYRMLVSEKRTIFQWVILLILLILSSMVSFSAFIITFILEMISLIIYFFGTNYRVCITKKEVLILVGGIALILGLEIFDSYIYISNESWIECGHYRGSVEKILAYGSMEYDDTIRETYDLNEIQYNLLRQGLFADGAVNKYDLIQKLSLEHQGLKWNTISRFFKSVPIRFFKMGMFYYWLVLIFMLLFSSIEGKRKVILLSLGSIFVIYFVMFLFYADKMQWIGLLVFLPISSACQLMVNKTEIKDYKTTGVYLAVSSVVLYTIFSSQLVTSASEDDIAQVAQDVQENGVYVIDIDAYLRKFSIFQAYPVDSFLVSDQIYFINGIYSMALGYEGSMINNGIDWSNGYEWLDNSREVDIMQLLYGE